MMMQNQCEAARPNPMIYVNGVSGVRVDRINTLPELFVASKKFAAITQAEKMEAVARLSTAVGDLSASVYQGDEPAGYAAEIANVLVALGTLTAVLDTEPEYVYPQIGEVMADQVNGLIQKNIHNLMARANAAFAG